MLEGRERREPIMMALGAALAWPAGPSAYASGTIVPFTEEAVSRGLVYVMMPTTPSYGYGCAFADLDNDGDQDAFLIGSADGSIGVFANDGSGTFTRAPNPPAPFPLAAAGLAIADYDGDGLLDAYVTRWDQPNVLLRNLGGLQFADVTAAAGVGDPGRAKGAGFGDFDGDGRLDLYLCNYGGAVNNRLYRNQPGGAFIDVAAVHGVDNDGLSFESVWSDLDDDGDVDLYLSNDKGQDPDHPPNQIWRNDDGVLVNVSAGSGADLGFNSMGVACGDFDGEGLPDLYCTNVPAGGGYNNPLLLNLGACTFVEASVPAGVENPFLSWGAIFFDFDNNGHQDLYVNNMFERNTLFANDGTFPVQELGTEAGVDASTTYSFSAAVADVDGDGDLDLLVNNLGGNVELFINHEGELRNRLRLDVVGEGANGFAVGARLDVRTASHWQMREVLAGGNTYLGQNEMTVHVGLDTAVLADEVVVRWPGGTPVRVLSNLPANQTWTAYPPSRLGDADGDGSVNLDDYHHLAACYHGGFAPGCEMMDFDGSSVIDLDDADAFLLVYDHPILDCDGSGVADLIEKLLDPKLDQDFTGIPDVCEQSGDLDGDGAVGTSDLLILLAGWGACAAPPAACPADVNGSGAVGTSDLLILLSNWG